MRIEKIMQFLKGFGPIVAQLDVEERESWVEQHTQEKMPEKIHTYSTIQLWAAPTAAATAKPRLAAVTQWTNWEATKNDQKFK